MVSRILRSIHHLVWVPVAVFVIFAFAEWGPDSLKTYSSLLTSLVAVVPYRDTIKKWFNQDSAVADPDQLDSAAAVLRNQVKVQCAEDVGLLHLREPQNIMTVPWEAVNNNLTSTDPRTVTALVDSFAREARRLIVEGPAGSGKTSLSHMIAARLSQDDERPPIPIRFRLSAWRPRPSGAVNQDSFLRWLKHRIREENDYLGNPKYGIGVVETLLKEGRIVVILDGLDELPAERARVVIDSLEERPEFADRYVLTSRPDQLRAALRGRNLPNVERIRLLPMDGNTAGSYIEAQSADDTENLSAWNRVEHAIRRQPDSPLTLTLSNPLMARLAIDAYRGMETSPDELLDTARFPDRATIERHLLERTLQAAYVPDHSKYNTGKPKIGWPIEDALHYHRRIARHMADSDINELSWWKLHEIVPRKVLVLTPMIVGALLCMPLGTLLFGVYGHPALGVALGAAAGLVGGSIVGTLPVEPPRRFALAAVRFSDLTSRGAFARNLGFALVGVINGGVLVGLLYPPLAAAGAALVFGLVFGLARLATTPIEPKEPATPIGTMVQDRRAVLIGAGWGAAAGAVVGGIGAPTFTPRVHMAVHLAKPGLGLLGAGLGVLLAGAGLGLMLYSTSAWGSLTTVRLWLALRRFTPLRLMTFLHDAHEVEIMRVSGRHYQYRHLLVQELLAEQARAE
ncbi:hypothetical protein ABH935_004178 [Catenulispora sp. GAS73]|uniref:NACHT domain-containing protein n=1 Tax=Catenulispora sp. GAS73 TaxID=3156269 RepID=UPI00351603E8